jgi:hypothetical protein
MTGELPSTQGDSVMPAPMSNEIVIEIKYDPLITLGEERKYDRAHISEIRRAANGIILGTLGEALPLTKRPLSIKWLFVYVAICLAFSWIAAALNSLGLLFSAVSTPLFMQWFNAWGHRQKLKSIERLHTAAAEAHAGERLRAYLHEDDTAEIELMADVPFEPVVIHRAQLFPKIRYYYLVGILGSIAIIFLVRPILPFSWIYLVWFIVLPSAGILFWLYPHANPWYYRITPGRMDLMRFEPFRRRRAGTILREWNLREAWIECFDGVVSIRPTRDGADVFQIKVSELAEPQAFVHALFRGAISTHEAPALPRDQLC